MASASTQTLDQTGTQAALYPTEDELWVNGPPINDPGNQGVVYTGPPAISPQYQEAESASIHEQLNGETSNEAYAELWVNPQEFGPTGFGPYVNEWVYESGHTQIILSNPSAEQGWGVGPARRWAHFPIEDSPNPFRNRMVHMRNGDFPWVTVDSYLYERTQLAWEQQWDPYMQRSPVTPVVNVSPSVPFGSTVPTYGGGAIPIPGVDVPFDDNAIYG